MDTQPFWLRADRPQLSSLSGPRHFDVIVIGGGITGLTAALRLKQAGKTVCVLEKGRIGGGETGHTSAHLSAVTDLRIPQLISTFGEGPARLVWSAGMTAIDFIETTVHEHQIDCQFQRIPGILHAPRQRDVEKISTLKNDVELAQKLGIAAQFMPMIQGVQRPGVVFPDQARFQPVSYVAALAQKVNGNGCAVLESSEAEEFSDNPHAVTVNGMELKCDHVILATHVPLMGIKGILSATLFQSKIYPYSTYVIQGTIPKGTLPDALFWDTCDPYHYMRLIPGNETDEIIFGGADHKTGQVVETGKQYAQLEAALIDLIPSARITRRWSGQVIETNDGLPYIGETAPGQFAATGFSGNGLTFGTLAGMMACDWALGRDNPWSKLFSADRTHLWGGTWEYLVENVDYPRYMISQWLLDGTRETPDSVRPGEGKVLVHNGQRVACSRDDQGKLSQVSAVCTHLGCLVRWNGAEKTWDCPCHGSRFMPSGEVIGGPAETPLAQIEEPVDSRPRRVKPKVLHHQ